jgi:hypothetical protein
MWQGTVAERERQFFGFLITVDHMNKRLRIAAERG